MNRIEQAKVHAAMAKVVQGDGYAQGKEWAPKVSGLIDALLDAIPVVEAAMELLPGAEENVRACADDLRAESHPSEAAKTDAYADILQKITKALTPWKETP